MKTMTAGAAVSHRNGAALRFAWINLAGGSAVLASYGWGLAWLGDRAGEAWGGVPADLRRWYTVSMLAAAAGYFPMTHFVLDLLRSERELRFDPARLYVLILVGSALWLPLTCMMLESPGLVLWWLIRMDLAIVGIASVAVLALVATNGRTASTPRWLATLAGATAFCLQSAVLDAIVWPSHFPIAS